MNAYTYYTDGRAATEATTNRANYNAVMLQLIGVSPGIRSHARIPAPSDSEDSDDSDSDSDGDSDSDSDSDDSDSDISEDGDNGWRAYGGNGIDPDIWAAWVTPTRELAQ